MPGPDVLIYALGVMLVIAGVWDIVQLRIPNILVLAVLALFCAYAALSWSTIPLLSHLGSGAIMLAVGLLLFAKTWWGGGDAKLAFASALWFPLADLPFWVLATAGSGGVLALMLLFARRLIPEAAGARLPAPLRRRGPLPYGVAIAAGTLLSIAFVPPQAPRPALSADLPYLIE